ncbi:arginase family protein [Xinfangfangia pollutisoli]|uniref:arginase family protein n=1 Tax=Xinfangfangia pollutisoli TaxID=2865960 RepID=UPI001CD59D5E|nr:arginase family protein [Xinfangfangia pollutisoli]
MSVAKLAERVSLIGLPYHCGTRGRVTGATTNAMAIGPEVLLAPDHAPALLAPRVDDLNVELLVDAEVPRQSDTGGDYRLIPAGDQMGRILVQNTRLAEAVREARRADRLPIVSLGTCSGTLGVVAGLSETAEPFGVLWLDAHGDAMTPETSSNGFIEGMVTTTITGKCWKAWRENLKGFRVVEERNFVSIGLHEAFSAKARAHAGIAVGTLVNPPVIQRLGFERAIAAALDLLSGQVRKVYIHVDTDVLDPETALAANRHCAEGGLTTAQVASIFSEAADRFEILATSFSSYDPDVDPRGPDVIGGLMLEAASCMQRSRTN